MSDSSVLTDSLPWPCHLCSRSFVHARFLSRHVLEMHYAEMETSSWEDRPGTYVDQGQSYVVTKSREYPLHDSDLAIELIDEVKIIEEEVL